MTWLYRRKPVVVEARRINADDWGQVTEIAQWCNADIVDVDNFLAYDDSAVMAITTLEGVMYAEDGDWIIRGVIGEFYPIKSHVFEATYEPVVEP
jgi:hypothetical protein